MASYFLLPAKPTTGLHLNCSLQTSRRPQILVNPCRHVGISSSVRRRLVVLRAAQAEDDAGVGGAAESNQVPPTMATPLTPTPAIPPPATPLPPTSPVPPMPHHQHHQIPSPPPQSSSGSITITPAPGIPTTPGASQGVTIDLFNLPPWIGWVFGSFFFSAVPIYRRMKMAQENVEKTLGVMAKAVEKAAEETDKLAEELAESLPEGKLKEVARNVEMLAEMVDKEAEGAADLIEKVDELTDRLEETVDRILEVEGEVDLHVNNDSGSKNLRSKM